MNMIRKGQMDCPDGKTKTMSAANQFYSLPA